MFERIEDQDREAVVGEVWAEALRVCRRIPPLWDLKNYVAVNPFLGFTETPIEQAAGVIGDGLGARVVPGLDHYRGRWKAGDFGPADLAQAAARAGRDAASLGAVLAGRHRPPARPARQVLTFAERHDLAHGGNWEDAVVRQITRWCAVHALGGGAYWPLPADGRGLYASWREAAQADRTLEVLGLSGWRRFVGDLPEEADAAVARMLSRLGVAPEGREDYLYRLLGRVYGWASFFRRDGWKGGADPVAVAELLAVRVSADAAVAELAPRRARPGAARAPGAADHEAEDEAALLVFQDALEDGFVRRLLHGINLPRGERTAERPAVQAVFCIDVRSEPFRRHIESLDPAIETRGFAGFFGVPLDWRGECDSPRCPVLLEPVVKLHAPAAALPGAARATVKHLQGASGSAFNYVELLGMAYGLGLVADALAVRSAGRPAEGTAPLSLDPDGRGGGIPLPTRVELAAGILKNMGLRHAIARLVLLCGHEGHSANNPHAAGLDCGACGGHGGALNARVAAALLNDPSVREALRKRGRVVPDDTRFVAGIHDTTTDDLTLLDVDGIPPSHRDDLRRLQGWLEHASALTRAERAPMLGLRGRQPAFLERWLRRRARDWSEVRPEWGLARNAAFIAARRARTRGVDLQGRVFLHEYDATLDPDDSVLTLILTAPMIVASWINLQYLASTVDNNAFGCGTKTLHNRVGTLGVVVGNGGDLRTGLPLQSVLSPDGRWFHEPLRLQVVIETSPSRIDAALAAQPAVRDLVNNGWVRLFTLDPEGMGAHLRLRSGEWEPVTKEQPSVAYESVGMSS